MGYGHAEGLRTKFFVEVNGGNDLLEDQVNTFLEENADAEVLDFRFLSAPTAEVKEGALLYCPAAWVIYRPSKPSVYEDRGF